MKHGALFNGIGGFQLAAHWMGWENVMHCEIDDFCNKVVKKHFPNSIQHGDIRISDFKEYRGTIDILTGGFPCQPFSTAGQRKGTSDNRHLWPEMLRAIREISPPWVVGENVRGLINWSKGLVFDQVQADLETEGYEVLPFLFPACAVNAPHRRDRIWFVAHANSYDDSIENRSYKNRRQKEEDKRQENKRQRFWNGLNGDDEKRVASDTVSERQPRQGGAEGCMCSAEDQPWKASWSYDDGRWPTQSPVCRGDDGIPDILDRLKSLGNAIVPEAAYQIFKAIDEYESLTTI